MTSPGYPWPKGLHSGAALSEITSVVMETAVCAGPLWGPQPRVTEKLNSQFFLN